MYRSSLLGNEAATITVGAVAVFVISVPLGDLGQFCMQVRW